VRNIFKYELSPGTCYIDLPVGAIVLSAKAQNDCVCVWASVDPHERTEVVRFMSVLTGLEFPAADLEFIDTVLLASGNFVVHVFKEKRK
jgi:hypothetical protein